MKILATYIVIAVVFLGIDLLWLGVIAKGFYNEQLGSLLADSVRWIPALVFYLFYVGAILYLAVLPALQTNSFVRAAVNAAVLGAAAYGAYELTNLATLKHWPLQVAMVDLVWGTVLTTLAACAGYLVLKWLR